MAVSYTHLDVYKRQVPDIAQLLKAAISVGNDIRKAVRVCQRGKIDLAPLCDEPGAEVYRLLM